MVFATRVKKGNKYFWSLFLVLNLKWNAWINYQTISFGLIWRKKKVHSENPLRAFSTAAAPHERPSFEKTTVLDVVAGPWPHQRSWSHLCSLTPNHWDYHCLLLASSFGPDVMGDERVKVWWRSGQRAHSLRTEGTEVSKPMMLPDIYG